MKWITKRYDQVFLGLTVAALLTVAIVVLRGAGSFQGTFSEAKTEAPISPPVADDGKLTESVKQSNTDLSRPFQWTLETNDDSGARGSLFVSQQYVIDPKTNRPIKLIDASLCNDSLTGQPIPARWFIEHHLNPLEANAALQDPDKDGFTNEEERRNHTDPTNKDSHPPYYTKLFLKQSILQPFRLTFKAFNGEISKPKTWEFQIDTADLKQPSNFLKIGDRVPNTHFKLEKFEFKERENLKIREMEDVSELTLTNTETGESVVLSLGKVKDAGDTYALFDYQWPPAAGEIRVKKLQEFGLRPETGKDQLYTLADVNDTEATIHLPDGTPQTIARDPRKPAR